MTAKSDIYYIVLKVLKVLQLLIFVKIKWGSGGGKEEEEKFLKIEFLKKKDS